MLVLDASASPGSECFQQSRPLTHLRRARRIPARQISIRKPSSRLNSPPGQALRGDELHPHMLRHGAGYALINDGELDDDPDIQPSDEHRPDPVQFKIRRCRQDQMNILLTEMTLLRDLALVPQPKTLVEAAVQLALLFISMGYELDTDDVEEMRAGFKKAHRATAGLARAVAAAAGVDLTEFGEVDMVSLMDQKCPELGPTEQAPRHPDVKW
jgi:hypothetical protein